MGDEGEFWNDVRQAQREERARLGVACPECVTKLPKANPSILLPGQRCRIHGYRDPRERSDTPRVPVFKATSSKPKGVCLNRAAKLLCAWPRCHCNIDLVYMTDCRIQRPQRTGK